MQALPHPHPRELLLPCQPPAEAADHEQAAGVGGAGAGAGHRSRPRLLPPAGPGQATARVHDQRRVLAGHTPPLPRGGAGKTQTSSKSRCSSYFLFSAVQCSTWHQFDCVAADRSCTGAALSPPRGRTRTGTGRGGKTGRRERRLRAGRRHQSSSATPGATSPPWSN